MSSRYIVKPSGLSCARAAQQNPPEIWERFIFPRSIEEGGHAGGSMTLPMLAEPLSANSPVIPPTLNSAIFSPPFAPLAQKTSLVAPVRSKPPGSAPQLLGGFCQYIPAHPAPCF